MNSYKYVKYKHKYLNFKNQFGGDGNVYLEETRELQIFIQ